MNELDRVFHCDDVATSLMIETIDHTGERSGFTCAVRAEKAEHFALIHVQIHVENASSEAVIFREIVYFNYVHKFAPYNVISSFPAITQLCA